MTPVRAVFSVVNFGRKKKQAAPSSEMVGISVVQVAQKFPNTTARVV